MCKVSAKNIFWKKWHPSSGILSKNFQFSNLKSNLFGNFSTFSTNSKIPKIYLSGPISVQSFSKKYFLKKSGIQAVGFWAKISNFQTWNRIYSENFPLFQLFRKFRNFIHLSLQVCQVSAKRRNFFSSSSSSFIHHHDHSLRSWLCRLGVYR